MRIAILLTLFALFPLSAQELPDLRTRAETTDYVETSSYDDVMRLAKGIVASSPLARYESFGTTEENRELPLLILSDPAVPTPEAARKLGRPIVFVQANIHAGEVEGKEAAIILARRLTSGDLRPMLQGAGRADRAHLQRRRQREGQRSEPDGAERSRRRRRHARELEGAGSQSRLHEARFGRSARAGRLDESLGSACGHRSPHDQRFVSRLSPDLFANAQPQR